MRTKSANFFLSDCEGDISASNFLLSSTAIGSSRSQARRDGAQPCQAYPNHMMWLNRAPERILPRRQRQGQVAYSRESLCTARKFNRAGPAENQDGRV